MCKAIEDMRKHSREEGILEVLAGLVKDGILTITDAAKRAGLTADDFLEKTAGL